MALWGFLQPAGASLVKQINGRWRLFCRMNATDNHINNSCAACIQLCVYADVTPGTMLSSSLTGSLCVLLWFSITFHVWLLSLSLHNLPYTVESGLNVSGCWRI